MCDVMCSNRYKRGAPVEQWGLIYFQMSYAAVAGSNTLPQSQQPHPDPALFETGTSHSTPPSIPDDTKKVNVVPSDFKSHPATVTSEQHIPMDDDNSNTFPPPIKKNKKNKRVQEVEAEGLYLWEVSRNRA